MKCKQIRLFLLKNCQLEQFDFLAPCSQVLCVKILIYD